MFIVELETFNRKTKKYKFKKFTDNNDKVVKFKTKEEAEEQVAKMLSVFFIKGRVVPIGK